MSSSMILYRHLDLVVDDSDDITNSELHSVVTVDNDATSRASSSWRSSVITISATLASVKHDSASSAHLGVIQWSHPERAWSWSAAVHNISAATELVLASWSRAGVADALHGWLVAASSATTVTNGVDCPLS